MENMICLIIFIQAAALAKQNRRSASKKDLYIRIERLEERLSDVQTDIKEYIINPKKSSDRD